MKLIVACDPNGGIGINNTLPWPKLKGDLARFRELTEDKIVVMGRQTWNSLPVKPLPNRLNIVITTKRILADVLVSESLHVLDHFPDAWLIGGAMLINACWDKITEVHLSRTFAEYDCDRFIDLVKLKDFTMTHIEHCEDHTYEIWNKT